MTDAGRIERTEFVSRKDSNLPPLLADAALSKCTFASCHYGNTAKTPEQRRVIRNVTLTDCRTKGTCTLGPVIVEDVEIRNLTMSALCIAWGSVYRHVRVEGRCDRLMLSFLPTPVHSEEKIELFERADAEFYAGVDWALDISRAEARDLDIRGVPARLIRRDPETQVVVRREKVVATQSVWQSLDLSGSPWVTSMTNLLNWGIDDMVLIAPKRSERCADWVRGLRALQAAGVAEVD